MSFFRPELASPDSFFEIFISPLLCAFFGLMMFIGAVRYEENYGKPAKWWVWCFLPIGLGVLFGIQRMMYMTDFFYIQTVYSRKLRIGHYLSLAIPLFALAIVFFGRKIMVNRKTRSTYAGLT
jgi:hypothetical protein